MTVNIYREDDLLSTFGKYLSKNNFLILSLSGNQQGQYWFQMGDYRKAPDIIAVRQDIILVGEAKVKSRELFKSKNGRPSDYQSLQYLLDNAAAKEQVLQRITASLSRLDHNTDALPPMQMVAVGGDSFTPLQNMMDDHRIWCFAVEKSSGIVTPDWINDRV